MRGVLLLVLLGGVLSGCANPGIVNLSPDTYMLSRSDHGGVFGNASAMKADVIREASEFAAKQGKIAIPLSINETPMFPGHFATIDYQFRVVDKDDPEARRVNLVPRPNVVIERNDKSNVDITTHDQTKTDSAGSSSVRRIEDLQTLKDRGLITDAEYQQKKKQILDSM